LQGKVATLEIN